jgi:hypothetical protein
MIWHNQGYNHGDATLWAKQDRPDLHGLASLCRRARLARLGRLGSNSQTPPHTSLEDGQGGSDSNPAS